MVRADNNPPDKNLQQESLIIQNLTVDDESQNKKETLQEFNVLCDLPSNNQLLSQLNNDSKENFVDLSNEDGLIYESDTCNNNNNNNNNNSNNNINNKSINQSKNISDGLNFYSLEESKVSTNNIEILNVSAEKKRNGHYKTVVTISVTLDDGRKKKFDVTFHDVKANGEADARNAAVGKFEKPSQALKKTIEVGVAKITYGKTKKVTYDSSTNKIKLYKKDGFSKVYQLDNYQKIKSKRVIYRNISWLSNAKSEKSLPNELKPIYKKIKGNQDLDKQDIEVLKMYYPIGAKWCKFDDKKKQWPIVDNYYPTHTPQDIKIATPISSDKIKQAEKKWIKWNNQLEQMHKTKVCIENGFKAGHYTTYKTNRKKTKPVHGQHKNLSNTKKTKKNKKISKQSVNQDSVIDKSWDVYGSTRVKGTRIGHNAQHFGHSKSINNVDAKDRDSYGYDFVEAYGNNSKKSKNCFLKPGDTRAYGGNTYNGEVLTQAYYAEEAKKKNAGAVIAHAGAFSNVDNKSFHDPVTGVTFNSAEQMFHYYKEPPGSPNYTLRSTVSNFQGAPKGLPGHLKDKWPDSNNLNSDLSKKNKKSDSKAEAKKLWGKYNLSLEIYMQLVKAADPNTGLKDALDQSGDAFIIEDTAYRRLDKKPECFHGDNGDGTGQNKLGYSQMEARRIMNDNKGALSQQQLQKWFKDNVEPQLKQFYKEVYGYKGNVN